MSDQELNEYNAHESALSSLTKVVEQLENSLTTALSMSDEMEGKLENNSKPEIDRRSGLKQWIAARTEETALLENRLRSILARLDI